jgi:hypothetical protein
LFWGGGDDVYSLINIEDKWHILPIKWQQKKFMWILLFIAYPNVTFTFQFHVWLCWPNINTSQPWNTVYLVLHNPKKILQRKRRKWYLLKSLRFNLANYGMQSLVLATRLLTYILKCNIHFNSYSWLLELWNIQFEIARSLSLKQINIQYKTVNCQLQIWYVSCKQLEPLTITDKQRVCHTVALPFTLKIS